MGNSSSSETDTTITNNLKESIKNLNLTYQQNDNYINNTIKSAYTAAVSMANTMQSVMQNVQNSNLESQIESVMKQKNIKISGVKNSTVELIQNFTAKQVITAMAYMQALNEQETDMQTKVIASDILKATQSMDSLSNQAAKLASETSVSASQTAKASNDASTTNNGDVTV